MGTFAFEARDRDGRIVKGVETALDEFDLDRTLDGRGLLLVNARAGRRRARAKASARTLVDFCYHLSTILEAGIPLLEGLRDLQEGGASPIAQELDDIARKVQSGRSLSAAMASYPNIFPALVRSLVEAGEDTGKLDVVLRDLTAYLEWREELRRKVSGAAMYPCIVVVGLIGLVTLIVMVVLPKFLDIFVELNVELPLPTRALLALHSFASNYGVHTLVALVVLITVGFLYARTTAGRYRFHRLLLAVPVVGKTIAMVEMSRLAHNLGLLYSSGIPVTRCMELVETIVQNRVVRESVCEAKKFIDRGETLTSSLGRGGLMPPTVMRMVSLGEQSGQLDKSLDHVASYYDREIPAYIERALALVNTGVVLALGATVGTVALAIFVPMYKMLGNLNG